MTHDSVKTGYTEDSPTAEARSKRRESKMLIRKQNGKWYIDFYYIDPQTLKTQRCRRSTGLKATRNYRQAALDLAIQAKSVLSQSKQAVKEKQPEESVKQVPFSGFTKLFYDNHAVPTVKPTTRRVYEQMIRVHLHPYFGDSDMRDIEVEMVECYRARMLKTHSAKTVNNQLSLLSTIFKKAIQWGYCEQNPVQGTMVKVPENEMMFWESYEIETFLREVKKRYPDWSAFFTTALFTGMRLGELIALRWRDISFDRAQIVISRSHSHGVLTSTKSGKGRALPLHPRLMEALKEHRHLKGELVFCNEKGDYLTRDIVKGPFGRCIQSAHLPRIRIHDMRHSFASQAVIKGIPLPQVQQWLGHADIRTTMRYSHLAPAMGHDWMKRLGDTSGQTFQAMAAFQKSSSPANY